MEWPLWAIFLALGGFVGNFTFSVTDHAQNGFYHSSEWIPVCSSGRPGLHRALAALQPIAEDGIANTPLVCNQKPGMRTNETKILILLMLGLVAVVGCKTEQVYHASDSVVAGPGTNFHTAFIEFDDQGELWEPHQIEKAVHAIKTNQPVFLVTYVHGWKNNADFNNDNYIHFTNMLHALAEKLPEHGRMQVVGAYLAWRGDSVAYHDPISSVARQLSFWSRMEAAERVAGTSATEALYSIMQAANSNPNSKVILMGHSMGALILEKALSQAMVGSLLSGNPKSSKAPADLVVLINSAASSIQARQLISMVGRLAPESAEAPVGGSGTNSAPFSREHPLVISATSKGDWATGKVFPLGMWFSSLGKSFRPYATNEVFGGKQASYYTTTPGHNENLWSHKIVRIDSGKVRKARSNLQTEQEAFRTNLGSTDDRSIFKIGGHLYQVKRIPKSHNNTPYWVMQVPTAIIKDHEDIFNDRFTGFIGGLFRMTEVTEKASPRRSLERKHFKQQAD